MPPHTTTPSFTLIGRGVYSIGEAARYTGLKSHQVAWWFRGGKAQSPDRLFQTDYARNGHSLTLSFHDLIDVLVAGKLREYGMSLQGVRVAYLALAKELDTPHPFCHSRLSTDGKRAFLRIEQGIGSDSFSEVVSGQRVIPRVVENYLRHVDYSETTNLALRWRVSRGVVIDPAISLGKPVIESTGVATYVVSQCFHANNRNPDLVADLFDLRPEEVINAVRFEESLYAA